MDTDWCIVCSRHIDDIAVAGLYCSTQCHIHAEAEADMNPADSSSSSSFLSAPPVPMFMVPSHSDESDVDVIYHHVYDAPVSHSRLYPTASPAPSTSRIQPSFRSRIPSHGASHPSTSDSDSESRIRSWATGIPVGRSAGAPRVKSYLAAASLFNHSLPRCSPPQRLVHAISRPMPPTLCMSSYVPDVCPPSPSRSRTDSKPPSPFAVNFTSPSTLSLASAPTDDGVSSDSSLPTPASSLMAAVTDQLHMWLPSSFRPGKQATVRPPPAVTTGMACDNDFTNEDLTWLALQKAHLPCEEPKDYQPYGVARWQHRQRSLVVDRGRQPVRVVA
ncbi:hypothetical protein FISHEDRAFT_69360 [Fistulina hepatica ATCC 64428]|uniref:Uncharacterized protein n=1 Tax=Fistulina hepatica ATCC 64428 TaxID=1128425 RepID=A0A0D7AMC2_9AGAR|nr:hypothetical protein FISHEDRAFT_69360 [Fistulina hepatica ATCC 64428]